ncbi:MAG: bifunctional proline dehydrogenase/L-glutamate gamma-semialdehyde dehydrogenase PutA, partial [Proteobacteria bacterium]|nr:bifunctional proline dehydrogenase/L-glutamate gamma-semialdehyde dehydrogenase PutA [Pseudomonadota bacterium]
ELAISSAHTAAASWDAIPAEERAAALDRIAELFEANRAEFYALCIREAGKTLDDAVSEVREAVDFCRYYAWRAREEFAAPQGLPGPTGEKNSLSLHGRGVFACISPWNFPLAIFTGQITAALAAGNAVIAKPAEQTPLIAALAVALMLEGGIPSAALHLLPGDGATVGAKLVSDERVSGVVFTGSFETAQIINRTLAARSGPIVPFIAETGGQNALIVDSSALPEQVVDDAILSAFQSAGQRCSALRCLYVQADIADRLLEMLVGRAAEVSVGDPLALATDVGPVIDEQARDLLDAHVREMEQVGELLFEADLPETAADGTYFAPRIYLIDGIHRLEKEVFGPILHVVRYKSDDLQSVVDAINGTGYGLTVGIHSRVDETVESLRGKLRAGNIYVNRNMIGAVVGVQPFGGEGLSGTGPKAGGPHYLARFATERTTSVDTTAAGGNTALLSLG